MAKKGAAAGAGKSSGEDINKLYTQWFGGIVRDDKATGPGQMSNVEELDILENANFVRPTQIFSADTFPANITPIAYTVDDADVGYALCYDNSNHIVICTKSNASANTPGSWSTLTTLSSDTYNILSPIQYHKVTESGTVNKYVYFVSGTNTLKRYGPLGGSPTLSTVGTLSQLVGTGSYDRIAFRRFYGTLYIPIGQYVSQVDDNGIFTEKKFTAPFDVYCLDIAPASDVAVILCRYSDRTLNMGIGYWWDLVSPTTFQDHFDIPMGGPQWIYNYKQTIIWLCAFNSYMRLYQLSSPNPGATVIPFPNVYLTNVALDADTQPVSPVKSTFTWDDKFYFGLNKTDKTGIYAIGKLDYKYPIALWLAKRFNTTNYALHQPTAAFAIGQNFFASYSDNGTQTGVSMLAASAARSSKAVIESTWQDNGQPVNYKDLMKAYMINYPLASGCSLSLSVAGDYGSYVTLTTAGGVAASILNAVRAIFRAISLHSKTCYKFKVSFTSNGANCPILTTVAMRMIIKALD